MNSFFRPRACQANASDSRTCRDFTPRTAALAVGVIGAIMISLALVSAAPTFGDRRDEGGSVGATVRKGAGKCKVAPSPAAFAM
jgi:hypothetical protein